ncbi:MarR family transcriptional regulator, partial [Amycolatopsis rhizosphaerae]|uniref:MarR family transcriptional regulator n=1 Tax=Amycolatopsis rhizosphaerae TaxID=2053003 RepID=UPI001643C20A
MRKAGDVRAANEAAVLTTVLASGPLSRGDIGRETALSIPTVSRVVTRLTGLRLLREAPDPRRAGGVGRPSLLVEVDDDVLAACGVHV